LYNPSWLANGNLPKESGWQDDFDFCFRRLTRHCTQLPRPARIEAIAHVFDTNGDGKLSSADADFGKFKLEVVNADGTTSIQTLAQADITSINLKADTTNITLPDGSVITGQTTYTKTVNGVTTTGTVANTTLATDADGHRVEQTASVAGGTRTTTTTGFNTDGSKAFVMVQTLTIANGNSVTRYDDNADGTFDRTQTVTLTLHALGFKTETVINRRSVVATCACQRTRQRYAQPPLRKCGLDSWTAQV
jgi:hypothetical protein